MGAPSPSVAVLVIDSDHHPAYACFRRVWRESMRLFEPQVRAWFVRMDPSAPVGTVREDAGERTIFVGGPEGAPPYGVPWVLRKTVAAMRHVGRQPGASFDYVVRTNLSSFLILDRLVTRLAGLPRSGVVQGVRGRHGAVAFPSGACTILSADAAAHLVDASGRGDLDHSLPDDVTMGACLVRRFGMTEAPRVDVATHPFDAASIGADAFHVRTKSADRFADARLHVDLFDRFHGERLGRKSGAPSLSLVTFYLALPDAVPDPRGPPFYLRHARELFESTSLPIVAYVDEAHVGAFRACVPSRARVRVEPASWSEIPTGRYVERVRENRVRDGTIFRRGRNTPERFAVVSSKWHFLRRAMDEDPFGTSHVGWIDVGLSHATGAPDLAHLDGDVARAYADFDRVRIGRIHWRRPSVLRDLAVWYGPLYSQRCAFAGGFFTADVGRMRRFCTAFDVAFVETVARGFGHGDEGVIATVFGRHPEWFDPFPSDYFGLLANYAGLRRDLDSVLRFVVQEAREAGACDEARRVCEALHGALSRGSSFSDRARVAELYHEWLIAAWYADGGRHRARECVECLLRLETLALRPHVPPSWERNLDFARSLVAPVNGSR